MFRLTTLIQALLLVSFFNQANAAALPQNALSLQDLSKIKQVINAKISPNGEFIVYVQTIPREVFEDDDGYAWREMYVLDKAGRIRPFISGQEAIGQLQWASNSVTIWFLAKREHEDYVAIYVISLKGGEARRVINHDNHRIGFQLSKDGKSLLYWGEDKVSSNKQKLLQKGFKAQVFEEDQVSHKRWLAGLSGADRNISLLHHSTHVLDAQFTPDSKRILLQYAPSALVDDVIMRKQLSLIDRDGKLINPFNM